MAIKNPWIENSFFKLSTPIESPLFKGFYLLAARAECRKCGREHKQAIRVPLVKLPSFLAGDDEVRHRSKPTDERLAASFMLFVCDNAVGCYRKCRPWTHKKMCLCPGECACPRSPECVCKAGCANKGIHPCRCGRMFGDAFGKHKLGCPTGLFDRRKLGDFSVAFMRAMISAPARGRR